MMYSYSLNSHESQASQAAREVLQRAALHGYPDYYLGYFGGIPAYDPDDEGDEVITFTKSYTQETLETDVSTTGTGSATNHSSSDSAPSLAEEDDGIISAGTPDTSMDRTTALAARAANAAVQALRTVGDGASCAGGGGSGLNKSSSVCSVSPSTISDVVKMAMDQMEVGSRNESTRHYVKEYVTHLMENASDSIAVRPRDIPPELSSADEMRQAIRLGNFSKTAMCRYHKHGKCTRSSESCRFAHQINELRIRPILDKTSWCKEFKRTQSCSQGENCKFAHSADELRATENLAKTKACSFFARGTCLNGEFCRFSHGDL